MRWLTNAAGERTWAGSFVNTHERTLREVAVTVDFLDSEDRAVGKADAEAAELVFGRATDCGRRCRPTPSGCASIRYSGAWDRRAALMGPFREPWEFGYLMVDPAEIER